MPLRLHFCLFLLTQVFGLQAQQFNWATPVSGPSYQIGIKSVKDAQQNTYLVGFSTVNSFEYNGISYPANGNADAFFAKLDPNKNLLWIKSVGGSDPIYYDSVEDIHIDPFGDIYLIFTSAGNNFTYNGQVLAGIDAIGQYGGEAVLLKVDSDGNYIWHDSGTEASNFTGMTTDSNGNLYITGSFYRSIRFGNAITVNNPSPYDTRDLVVAKYQPNGTVVWAKHAGGTPQSTTAYGFDIEINPQTNEVLVLGHGSGPIFFGSVPMPTYNGSNHGVVLVSYNQNGTLNWVKRLFNGLNTSALSGRSLDISDTGTVGVVGITYNGGVVGFYNADGSVISEHAYPSTDELWITSIAFNEFNDAYISGRCDPDGILGMGPDTVTLSSATGFIAKIDVFQQVKWVTAFVSSRFSNQVHYENNGTITYAGRIDEPFTYNSGQDVIIPNAGDALFGELTDNDLTLSVSSFLPDNIMVYPNPTSGPLDIKANVLRQVEIYTIDGRLLESSNSHSIDLSQRPGGIYFLKITTGNGSTVRKVVLK